MTRARWIQLGAAVVAVGALELICRLGWVRPTTLVPPSVMVQAAIAAAQDPDTLADFGLTLSTVAIVVAI